MLLISFRNIIERTYPQRHASRESSVQSADERLLQRFKLAREKESQLKDKVGPQLRRDEIRRLVTGLCCIFMVVLALLVSAIDQCPSEACVAISAP